jgi:hypothetical protein
LTTTTWLSIENWQRFTWFHLLFPVFWRGVRRAEGHWPLGKAGKRLRLAAERGFSDLGQVGYNRCLEARFAAVWEIEMQAAAVANGVFVVVVNRAGVDDGLSFFGSSFAVDPYGQVVARAPEGEPALSLVDLDLDLVEQARCDLPFLRDRRPEMYGRLVKLAPGL